MVTSCLHVSRPTRTHTSLWLYLFLKDDAFEATEQREDAEGGDAGERGERGGVKIDGNGGEARSPIVGPINVSGSPPTGPKGVRVEWGGQGRGDESKELEEGSLLLARVTFERNVALAYAYGLEGHGGSSSSTSIAVDELPPPPPPGPPPPQEPDTSRGDTPPPPPPPLTPQQRGEALKGIHGGTNAPADADTPRHTGPADSHAAVQGQLEQAHDELQTALKTAAELVAMVGTAPAGTNDASHTRTGSGLPSRNPMKGMHVPHIDVLNHLNIDHLNTLAKSKRKEGALRFAPPVHSSSRVGKRGTIGSLEAKHQETGQELGMAVEALKWHSALRSEVSAWGECCAWIVCTFRTRTSIRGAAAVLHVHAHVPTVVSLVSNVGCDGR